MSLNQASNRFDNKILVAHCTFDFPLNLFYHPKYLALLHCEIVSAACPLNELSIDLHPKILHGLLEIFRFDI